MLSKLLAIASALLDRLAPGQPIVPFRKALAISIGVGITLFIIVFLNHSYGALEATESMVVAVFGVSGLLIFLFPNSKFYAPLTILEANLVAACVAFICVHIFSALALGLLFAILGTVLVLYLLACIHPPAIFLALVITIGGVGSLDFALYPILVDSLLLALVSHVYRTYLKHQIKH